MKKQGSVLRAPLSELNMQKISWDRDLLPEHLWIASLALTLGVDRFHHAYERFMDALDEFWPADRQEVCLGLLTDFASFSDDAREGFLSKHRQLARALFWDPIGEALSLYPESPAKWLTDALRQEDDGTLDPTRGLGVLRSIVSELLGGRSELATRVRVVPFGRPMKNGKMFFMKGMPTVDLLPQYPTDLSADERQQVEEFVRASMMAQFGMRDSLKAHVWPQHFWRQNYALAVCKPVERGVPAGMVATDATSLAALQERMEQAASQIQEYVQHLQHRVPVDVYDPRRDEVLLGLFARASRLLVLFLDDPQLWARDVGSILLRCLADTAITFVYLAKKGTEREFERFIEYGEGQLKLLMLHLQDNHPGKRSPEGASVGELEGAFSTLPEFVDIELGHWAGKDARKMASDAGMERLYRLVFTPASSDVHGSWLALRKSHLTFCEEPLHRFHRLPDLTEPPFFVSIAVTARELYEECRLVAVETLGYPEADPLPAFVDPEQESES
jgi:hypothetical protein